MGKYSCINRCKTKGLQKLIDVPGVTWRMWWSSISRGSLSAEAVFLALKLLYFDTSAGRGGEKDE